jgi:hypothetical protein
MQASPGRIREGPVYCENGLRDMGGRLYVSCGADRFSIDVAEELDKAYSRKLVPLRLCRALRPSLGRWLHAAGVQGGLEGGVFDTALWGFAFFPNLLIMHCGRFGSL